MTTPATPSSTSPVIDAQFVPLADLVPGDNPRRKRPDPAYVTQMAESMKQHHVLEPLIVRRHADKLQIVCGATRYTAALHAGLERVPVIIRDYTDDDVLEVQLIENIQRQSMHPIDEGEAFARLIKTKKHTPETLAKTIGKSIRWVYNRLEFTKLIPSLRQAFLQEEFTVSHAELLARLAPADQQRIDNTESDNRSGWRSEGLWRWDFLPSPDDKGGKARHRSVRSLRDVDDWIESNVRLDIASTAVQHLLPEIDDVQVEVQATHARLLQVATVFLLPQDPKLKKRFDGVLTDRHWKRAGGRSQCDFAEKAVIVFGHGQGEVLDVCVQKKRCAKHWPEHQPVEIEKRRKARAKQASGTAASVSAQQARDQREREKAVQARARWDRFKPALEKQVLAAAAKVGTVAGELWRAMLAAHRLPPATTAAQLPRVLLQAAIRDQFRRAWIDDEKKLRRWAAWLKVDVKAIEPTIAPKLEPEEKVLRGGTLKKQAGQRHVDALRKQSRKAGKKR